MPPVTYSRFRRFAFGLAASLLSCSLAPGFAQAHPPVPANPVTQPQTGNANRPLRIFTPPPAPNNGRAGRSRGTASRDGTCEKVDTPLTSLIWVYQTQAGDRIPYGQTTSDRPTLWFYLPYAIRLDRPAELRRETQDPETGETTQRTVGEFTQITPGIVGIQLPPDEPPLKVGQRYDWLFVVKCNPNDTSTHKSVEVSLQRVEPMDRTGSPQTTRKEQVVRYATAGLWENAFTLAAQLRSQDPQDRQVLGYWTELLQAIDLPPELATKPITVIKLP